MVSVELPKTKINILFAGWEVRMVKNCDLCLENAARGCRPRNKKDGAPDYRCSFR